MASPVSRGETADLAPDRPPAGGDPGSSEPLAPKSPEAAVAAALTEKAFRRRAPSWIARSGPYFLKIPRRSERVDDDLLDERSREEARREFDSTRLLASLDTSIQEPLALVQACIVTAYVPGEDLFDVARARARARAASAQPLLEEAVSLAARLHRDAPPDSAGLPRHDYRRDPFLPLPPDAHGAVLQRPRTLVVRGFEVRNFRLHRSSGRLVFFDPHEVVVGIPEEDFTRFVLSLLMIGWGRHLHCRTWEDFDPRRLADAYEEARGAELDREALEYTFDLNVAMRKAHAEREAARMSAPSRLVARAYARRFFRAVAAWRSRNGL